ncbi:unnamed protein product [Meganyctiphanes norvegica]|uniref:Protein kinase domain-containing protein n=1 Tax=Meganyctiphanes norvegica TaxID=48144 RepID=A0AAV2PIQ2_MEGNR
MPLFARIRDIFARSFSSSNLLLENPVDYWLTLSELGDEGEFGKIYKAQHKEGGHFATLKQIEVESEEDLQTFMVEVDILTELKHENILGLLEAYHYDDKLWMYLDYCSGGPIDTIMSQMKQPLNELQIADVCKCLCHALAYIHENKVIHRDLKAGNVYLTMEGGIKLAGFEVSAKNKNTHDKRGTFIGTPYWLAPEVILCESINEAQYDYKADIWSLGITLIEFAEMKPPNHKVSPIRVLLEIQKSEPPRLKFPSQYSEGFNDFISKCLVKDPELRPCTADLLLHPFLSQNISEKPIQHLLRQYKSDILENLEKENQSVKRKLSISELEQRTSRLSISLDVNNKDDMSDFSILQKNNENIVEREK